MDEIWKDIVGYERIYQVSNKGNIKRILRNKNKILRPGKKEGGYLSVCLSKFGEVNHTVIHRLVALHFKENPHNKSDVNHIDGDKENNNDWNLEWVTKKENINHAYKVLGYKGSMVGRFGENHNRSKKYIKKV